MRIADLALGAVTAWSAIGLVGSTLSWHRGERSKARRNLAWIAAVCLLYLSTLAVVSRTRPQRRLPLGTEECFGTVCFAVTGAEDLTGFAARGPGGPGDRERLVRVSVRVLNRAPVGRAARPRIEVHLLDSRGRAWYQVPGLTGVRLTGSMLAGQAVLSQPVFRVAPDATGLALVLSEGTWGPGLLEIGDTDSWLHRPTLLQLAR